jgi:hypothetical protein
LLLYSLLLAYNVLQQLRKAKKACETTAIHIWQDLAPINEVEG